MKKLFFTACALCSALWSFAQTTNYSLKNDGTGFINTFAITELNNASELTMQLWINPTEWVNGAILLGQDNISVELGSDQVITIKSGSETATAACNIPLNQWSQITVTLQNGSLAVYVNGTKQTTGGSLPSNLPVTNQDAFFIGKNFKGRIDEIRVWGKAIDEKDFFWYNTLHKYHPSYTDLIAYWKCDQELCEHLVDYKFNYHGVLNNVTKTAVTDNQKFKYRVVSGYVPSIMRFTDRPFINRDMFLMTNDAITLSAKVQNDGSLFPEVPDNSAVATKVDYLAEFEGKQGVMSFTGAGSQMVAEDGRITFSPVGAMGYTESSTASIASWLYIDEWKEGAVLFSKYQDEDNNFTIRLGNEANKEIVVDFCGTTATLPGKLELKKWQYVGVYLKPVIGELTGRTFNPIQIGVDFTVYGRIGTNRGVVLSGKNMTKTVIPLMESTPIVIGKDFKGKMDEIMVWGSDRSGSAESDATKGYKWNQGDWNAIFCNAYWKGDDPQQIGKDYQSYRNIINIMRSYYEGYRGAKVRIGIIYPQGEGWKNVLDKKENVDRLIADAKEILKDCDGLDVDLEWHGYNIVNNVVRRLINEVMAGNDDKIFSVSQHQYSYQLDKSLFSGIDYFTMQLYGPQPFSYDYDWYVNAYNLFINYGYPKDKLLLSYGVLLVNNGEEGYKDLFSKYGYNDDNFDPDLNTWNCNGTTKYFNGVNQTRKKQDFIIDNDCLGTMYFDMANDVYVHDPKSLIRAQNDVLNANVDTLITKVDKVPTGIIQVSGKKEENLFSFYPNPAKDFITVSLHGQDVKNTMLEIKSIDGTSMISKVLTDSESIISLENLNKGTYIIKVTSDKKNSTKKLQIN